MNMEECKQQLKELVGENIYCSIAEEVDIHSTNNEEKTYRLYSNPIMCNSDIGWEEVLAEFKVKLNEWRN